MKVGQEKTKEGNNLVGNKNKLTSSQKVYIISSPSMHSQQIFLEDWI